MSDKVRAYNIVMKIGGKLIAGLTDAGYDITPETEETLIKEDLGVKQTETVGYAEEFTVSSLMSLATVAEASTHTDFAALRASCRAGTELSFTYGWHSTGKPLMTGTGIITKYSEKAGATGFGDVSITIKANAVSDGVYSAT